jgi:hypothetical protein
MHPFGLYLAATDIERKNRAAEGQDGRPEFAPTDALPLIEPDRVSHLARVVAVLRRRAAKVAHVRGV